MVLAEKMRAELQHELEKEKQLACSLEPVQKWWQTPSRQVPAA